MIELIGLLFVLCGIPFFIAGTVGLLRFPDLYTRLHALTKADTMGLGLVAVGMALQTDSLFQASVFIVIWLLVLLASALGSYLMANHAYSRGIKPWSKR